MHIDENTIRQYQSIKKIAALTEERLNKLNKEIKDDLGPGEHIVGQYKVNISQKKKFTINQQYIRTFLPYVYMDCTEEVLNPDLVESAYLREEITDQHMRQIRGEPKIITSLNVEKLCV